MHTCKMVLIFTRFRKLRNRSRAKLSKKLLRKLHVFTCKQCNLEPSIPQEAKRLHNAEIKYFLCYIVQDKIEFSVISLDPTSNKCLGVSLFSVDLSHVNTFPRDIISFKLTKMLQLPGYVSNSKIQNANAPLQSGF